jgi:hypothetical protein
METIGRLDESIENGAIVSYLVVSDPFVAILDPDPHASYTILRRIGVVPLSKEFVGWGSRSPFQCGHDRDWIALRQGHSMIASYNKRSFRTRSVMPRPLSMSLAPITSLRSLRQSCRVISRSYASLRDLSQASANDLSP